MKDADHMVATGDNLPWLMAQLACWPTRVDEDSTTNMRFLMASAAATLKALTERKVTVVANISGGILQGASSDYPVDLYTLDFDDIPLDDPSRVIEVEGSEAYFGECGARVDPDFVREVVEAVEVADEDDCDSCGGLNTSCPEGCERDPKTGELIDG